MVATVELDWLKPKEEEYREEERACALQSATERSWKKQMLHHFLDLPSLSCDELWFPKFAIWGGALFDCPKTHGFMKT